MEDKRDAPVSRPSRGQKAFAAAVAAGTVSYLLLAITGIVKPVNRLTAAEFGVVVVAALAVGAALRPDLLDRLEKFDIAGIKFELSEVKTGQIELQKIQKEQQAVLEDVRLALRLLIGKNEQEHLINLFKQATKSYRVKGSLRDEIRRLRAMRLVGMCKDKTVAGMPENVTFDLADYIELTPDGLKFATRLTNQADAQAKNAGPTG
jgi:hypothetical protein